MDRSEQKLIHIPVTNARANNLNVYKDKQIEWWGSNPIYPYNAMLMSALYGMSYENTRKEMDIRDDVLFFGDSGGFQILQYKEGLNKDKTIPKKLTPEKVLDWQMKNCQIGMTLDIPTPRNGYSRDVFEEHLAISTENAHKAYQLKIRSDNEDFKLFNCIHGVNLSDMLRWHEVTSCDCEFDGYSLPTGSAIKDILPLRLGFAMEYSHGKPYHLLGVSSARGIMLMAYANKYTNTTVYFDSSAAAQGTAHHKYTNSWNIPTAAGIILQNDWRYPLPCVCPVCTYIDKFEDLCGHEHGSLISIHDLWWQVYYTNWVEALSHYPEAFITYAKAISKNGNLIRDMSFLDAVHEEGLETAYAKYFGKTQSNDDWL